MNTGQKMGFGGPAWYQSKTGLVLLAFLAIAAFFLITEHTAHFFGLLPYALLLLCPEALAEFGEEYARYAASTPAFLPWLTPKTPSGQLR